jgi:hypothetical protein
LRRAGALNQSELMVSFTKQTERRRRIRLQAQGKTNKTSYRRSGTPPFPIQPEGYDENAPDAKRPDKPPAQSK